MEFILNNEFFLLSIITEIVAYREVVGLSQS